MKICSLWYSLPPKYQLNGIQVPKSLVICSGHFSRTVTSMQFHSFGSQVMLCWIIGVQCSVLLLCSGEDIHLTRKNHAEKSQTNTYIAPVLFNPFMTFHISIWTPLFCSILHIQKAKWICVHVQERTHFDGIHFIVLKTLGSLCSGNPYPAQLLKWSRSISIHIYCMVDPNPINYTIPCVQERTFWRKYIVILQYWLVRKCIAQHKNF